MNKDVLSKINYMLVACGIDFKELIEYIPTEKRRICKTILKNEPLRNKSFTYHLRIYNNI